MGSSGRPPTERCRESRTAEYDAYYYTVLLSVGLKDAFGDEAPCSFKVSEPTMQTAGKKEVRPDAIFQCDDDTKGVVCEIKSSLPRDRRLLLRDMKERIGKHAEIEKGWITSTGRTGGHSVLLLVHKADMERVRDLICGSGGGESIPTENICLGHWEPARAVGEGPGAGDVLRLGREEGSTGCGYLDGRLDGEIEMPLLDMMAGYEKRRFVKADPPDLYMLTTIYQNILPDLVGDDGYIVVSIEDLKAKIADYYASWSGLPGEQSQARPRWVRHALDTLCSIRLAKKLPDGRYRINPLPRQKNTADFLLDRLCGGSG